MSNLYRASEATKVLVGILDGSSDPSSNRPPVAARVQAVTAQHIIQQEQSKPIVGNLTGVEDLSARPSVVVTVSNNTFDSGASLQLGPYTVAANVDFAVGGSATATAINITTAINRLPNFYATRLNAQITVYFMGGYGKVEARATYYGGVQNFTLSTSDGMTAAEVPGVGAPLRT